MTTADSLRFDIVDHVLLIVHADVPPDDADWARMVLVRNGSRDRIRGHLVIAPARATINATQRADVAKFLKETGMSIAVVTNSALVRGVALAVGLLGLHVRGFAPAELPSALTYLVVPPSRHEAMVRRIDALTAQLANARALARMNG
ncbi:MAG: hypothetical protein ABI488_20095 [Polyangiaceae bacterium]